MTALPFHPYKVSQTDGSDVLVRRPHERQTTREKWIFFTEKLFLFLFLNQLLVSLREKTQKDAELVLELS